ncbi:MAG: terminase small subunit, partial [Clostridia bacterium]|nr:terminase small subunit [Clostridia bacterium]
MSKALTPKQQAFVQEYLCDLNATQAAIRAGYSERTAGSQGERMLKNVEIQIALAEAQQK